MWRVFTLCRQTTAVEQHHPPPFKQLEYNDDFDTSLANEDDNLSLSSSLAEAQGPAPLSTYQTHSFQQRFHTDHPAPGSTKETFTSFMKRAASSLPPAAVSAQDRLGQGVRPMWWSYERDYDEKKEDSDEPEEEEEVDFEESSVARNEESASPPRTSPNSVAQANSCHDCFYGFGGEGNTSHLFAQHTIIRTDIQDLGSHKNVIYHREGEDDDQDHDVESIASECSDDFQPRNRPCKDDDVVDEAEKNLFFQEDVLHDTHVTTFLEDAPVRPQEEKAKGKNCFENILLVTPQYFDSVTQAPEQEKPQETQRPKIRNESPTSPSLSNMVHPMNLALFKPTPDDELKRVQAAAKRRADCSVASSDSNATPPATRKSGAVLHMDQYTLPASTTTNKSGMFETIRNKLASSFRSKASGSKTRVMYSLSKGKGGMSKKERLYSQSLLPSKPLISEKERLEASPTSTMRIPRSIPLVRDRPLSILLIHPVLKIFEIVQVDFLKDTTVGDALSKARANATDETLSEQKYVSLCNRKQELAAPMLPVSLLVQSRKQQQQSSTTKRGHSDSSGGEDGDDEDDRQDRINRREMEARLLVAVPEGSTAFACQAVRRMLWKNPKVQRWWKQTDPFHRPVDDKEAAAVALRKKNKKRLLI